VRRCPTPGWCRDTPVKTGDISGVPGLGRVYHYVDAANFAVFNIAMDKHFLAPGYVYRNATILDNGMAGIQTYGEGTGRWGGLNSKAAPPVWRAQDETLLRYHGAKKVLN
jgi:hypothetical protein